MERFFKFIRPSPLGQKVATRDGCIYLYQLMKFIGWIPPKKGVQRYLYWILTFTTFASGIVFFPVGLILSYVKDLNKFTPDEFLTSLQVCINQLGCAVKFMTLYTHLGRLRNVEDILDDLDKRVLKDSERQQVHKTVALSNYVIFIFTIIFNGYTLSTVLVNLASGRPPYSVHNPFLDWRDSQIKLYIQATTEYIMMTIALVQNVLSDTYLLVYIFLIRCHFNLLMDRVQNLRSDSNKKEDENYEDLVNCIKDHKMILECCDMIRPIISRTIFVQFALIGCVLGVTMISIFLSSNLWHALASFLFAVAVMMETFPFCYNCNLLIADCEAFGIRMFQSNWIDASPRYKSTLIQFMHQSQKPIVFIAGGIFPITVNSNITVAKFAFSVVTIVQRMNLNEKFK
ncbi:hypothetical protein ACLKA6_002121 [Drosophila palustris]